MTKKEALQGVGLFVLDMDGTVYLGNRLIDGALDFIRKVEEDKERNFVFFTNNASRVPSVYVEKLHKLGIDVDIDENYNITSYAEDVEHPEWVESYRYKYTYENY